MTHARGFRATWNDTAVAESEDTVLVDGYRYFPESSMRFEHLQPSAHHSVRMEGPGQASYYDVTAGDAVNPNAAWCYADPKPAARMVESYIGFWHGIRIEETPASRPARPPD